MPVSICIVFFQVFLWYLLHFGAVGSHLCMVSLGHVGVTKLSFIAWYSLQNLVIFRGIWYFLAVRAVRALILHGFLAYVGS